MDIEKSPSPNFLLLGLIIVLSLLVLGGVVFAAYRLVRPTDYSADTQSVQSAQIPTVNSYATASAPTTGQTSRADLKTTTPTPTSATAITTGTTLDSDLKTIDAELDKLDADSAAAIDGLNDKATNLGS